jgi:hypothetical protein
MYAEAGLSRAEIFDRAAAIRARLRFQSSELSKSSEL